MISVNPKNRTGETGRYGPDEFYVSLDINAGGGTGIETWIHDNASSYTTSFANAVNNALVAALGKTNRGVKKHQANVVGRISTSLILILLKHRPFTDTASDRNTLVANKQTCTRAIANGINSFAIRKQHFQIVQQSIIKAFSHHFLYF